MFPNSDSLKETMAQGPYDLFALLGEFWKQQLSDAELLRFHNFAKLMVGEDVLLRYDDLAAAAALKDLNPFLQRQWWLVELLESALTVEPNVITYGTDNLFYGGGAVYGQTASNSFAWIIPSQIRAVGLVMDSILNPSALWDIADFSFDPSTSVLRFDSNPFNRTESELLYNTDGSPKTYIAADGTTKQDRRLKLWLRNIEVDENTPFLRYGSIVGVTGTNSQAYVDTIRATWSMLVQGPSVEDLRRGLYASAGLVFPTPGEVVEVVTSDNEGQLVVTDRTVYRGHPRAVPLVSVGDVLATGQDIFDTVQVFELIDGALGDLSPLLGLALSPAIADVTGPVVLPNRLGSWTLLGYRDGEPEVRFEVLGHPDDVEAFWNAVHARGVAAAKPLADYVNASTAVNPMEFVFQNLIGFNTIVLSIRPEQFLGDAEGFLSRLDTLIPAGVLVLTQIALDTVQDSLDLGSNLDAVEVLESVLTPTMDVVTGGVPGVDEAGLTDYPPQVWNV